MQQTRGSAAIGGPQARSRSRSGEGIVPADTLSMFAQLVKMLGGEPDGILHRAGIEPRQLNRRNGVLTFREVAQLLHLAAAELGCADFGMRLAALQRGAEGGSLFELVMRHSPTVGEALLYCARHVQTYSGAISMSLDELPGGKHAFVRFETPGSVRTDLHQPLELMLLRTSNIVSDISGGRVSPRQPRFRHRRSGSLASYRRHFGCTVAFQQETNGFVLDAADLGIPVVDANPQLYEIATFYIANRFPALALPATARVKALVERLLKSAEHCTIDEIAARLGVHRRTMQRRLRDEGTSFEAVRDDVRREVARRCLVQDDVPLARLTEMLGYAEASALSRSCNRWFSASPRKLRKDLYAADPVGEWRPA